MKDLLANVRPGLDIAVVGISGKFPGAENVSELWSNLKQGKVSIAQFSDEELRESEVPNEELDKPNYVKAKGYLKNIEYFDASFFDYNAREAEILDPQIRMLTEHTWSVLEDAGYDPETYDGDIGFYVGATNNLYWQTKMIASGKIKDHMNLSVSVLSDKDHVSTRISYKLNLTGPSFTMETQCSTSLVSIHLAIQGLLSGDCDMALAGGVAITLPHKAGYFYQEGSIFSADGVCRTFDEKANGTVFGDGVGLVALKRIEDALADGDQIYGIVKGSAINNDGSNKVGYTAPSVEGQCRAIKAAQRIAQVEPESIGYVETHGTGTSLGDPIEIEALTQAFDTNKKGYCKVGSIKPNIGHLDNAAGVANFIKALLVLKNKTIPPSVNYEKPNPKIDFEHGPFVVNDKLTNWDDGDTPRRAGVSCYGVGGTNAHVILEEFPEVNRSSEGKGKYFIPISAKSEQALEDATRQLADYLRKNKQLNIADVAFTLQVGRRSFDYRRVISCESIEELITKLVLGSELPSYNTETIEYNPIFMFPGQGSQYVNMGRELYDTLDIFKEHLDQCFKHYETATGVNLKHHLFVENNQASDNKSSINETKYAQPLLFSIEYALAQTTMAMGVKPVAFIGHSIGEYVAACLSGVFSLEDAIKIVAIRGDLMQSMAPGKMIAVKADENLVKKYLEESMDLAAVNAENLCVISGRNEDIETLIPRLKSDNIDATPLQTSHAYHSSMMEPMLEEFEAALRQLQLAKPTIPFISNISGAWITEEQAQDPNYWTNHIRSTVRFDDGLSTLLSIENPILLEIGAGNTLTTFARLNKKFKGNFAANLLRHPKKSVSDLTYFFESIGQLWMRGLNFDFRPTYKNEERVRVSLPTYPFERKRYWVEGTLYDLLLGNDNGGQAQNKTHEGKWIYQPQWKKTAFSAKEEVTLEDANWLVFSDNETYKREFIDYLKANGANVIEVQAGTEYIQLTDNKFVFNVGSQNDYTLLFENVIKQFPVHKQLNIAHFFTVSDTVVAGNVSYQNIVKKLEDGLLSAVAIVKEAGKQFTKEKINFSIITANSLKSEPGHNNLPIDAVLSGFVKTVDLEYQHINAKQIDLDESSLQSDGGFDWYKSVLSNQEEKLVAFRDNERFVQSFEVKELQQLTDTPQILKQEGVYLITGGMGGIGLEIASYLAETVNAKLILVGRSPIPAREEWGNLINDTGTELAEKIRKIQEIETLGGKVLVLNGDISSEKDVENIVKKSLAVYEEINGVFHCAGVPGGQLIQLTDKPGLLDTLNPKVLGTLLLDQLLMKKNLDFLVLCSSISSVTGTFGQMAYAAANGFLDSYAQFKRDQGFDNVISINWDAWQKVGMAVKALNKLKPNARQTLAKPSNSLSHPLFTGYDVSGDEYTFYAGLSAKEHWVLDEHRIMQKPVVPGVTYIEMVREIGATLLGETPFEISNLLFLTPFEGGESHPKELRIVVKKVEKEFEFTVESDENGKVQLHAKGKFATLTELPGDFNPTLNVEKCDEANIERLKSKLDDKDGFVNVGPRWSNFKDIKIGENLGVATLALSEAQCSDLIDYPLHPALLDVAANFLTVWINEDEQYLPFSYKKLKVFGALENVVQSTVTRNIGANGDGETLEFDVVITGKNGKVLVKAEGYTLKKVNSTKTAKAPIAQKQNNAQSDQDDLLKDAILPKEGVDILFRILEANQPIAQWVVANQNLQSFLDQEESGNKGYLDLKMLKKQGNKGKLAPRPNLSTKYTPPKTKEEKELVTFFQDFLRIQKIGVFDDLFEFGITSLDVAQIKTELDEDYEVNIPVAIIFENPTIKSLAKYLGHNKQEEVTIDRKEALDQGKALRKKRLQRTEA